MLCRPTLQLPQRHLIELLYNIQRFVLHFLLGIAVVLVVQISDIVGYIVHETHHLVLLSLIHTDYDISFSRGFARLTGLFRALRRRLP